MHTSVVVRRNTRPGAPWPTRCGCDEQLKSWHCLDITTPQPQQLALRPDYMQINQLLLLPLSLQAPHTKSGQRTAATATRASTLAALMSRTTGWLWQRRCTDIYIVVANPKLTVLVRLCGGLHIYKRLVCSISRSPVRPGLGVSASFTYTAVIIAICGKNVMMVYVTEWAGMNEWV